MREKIQKYAVDIRFWLVFFFVIRLFGITNPPLEAASTWRQCDGLMIARNFYEYNSSILYPAVDLAGDKTGITGSEFPLFNYAIYLVSLVFGYGDWYGRLINMIISSLAIFCFYKLIRKYFDEPAAFNATIILSVSLWFAYSRITIPDTFAASLCMISLSCAFSFFEKGKPSDWIFFFMLGLLGCLAKISAAIILVVLAIPMLDRKVALNRKIALTAGAALILMAVYAWYFYWVPHLNLTYGFRGHFFMGQELSAGVSQLIENWPRVLSHFYETPLKFTGFAAFVTGVYLVIRHKKWIQLIIFLLPFSAFLYIIMVAGWNFAINVYYPLVFIPAMAFIAGCGLALIKNRKWVYAILIVVSAEGIIDQAHLFTIRYPLKAFQTLEHSMDSVGSVRSDLVAISALEDYSHDPTPMYFSHRKGLNLSHAALSRPEQLIYLREHNFKYIIILKMDFGMLELPLQKVHDSEYFAIYRL